ncbi:MAG TPA: helix-turn-helix domain-containing protein [Leadbetterella sp.]|nr:helix-turn-helix domain-containing protein [Leadbetterella sp.]
MNITSLFAPEIGQIVQVYLKDAILEATKQIMEQNAKPLSRNEAADFLGVDVGTLNRWEAKGIITYHYLGGKKIYLKSELINTIKQN